MTDEEETGSDRNDWSDAERRAFASLEREAPPPAGAEERVVAELASRGAFAGRPGTSRGPNISRSPRARVSAAAATAAAALLVFGAGIVVGRSAGSGRAPAASSAGIAPADAASPRFALFLLDEPPGGAAEETERVAEYKRWASSLPGGGRVVSGEKLGDEARLLSPAAPVSTAADPASALRGYFVIRAPDLARALEVARTCPHLKRGGRILVRPIVPV